MAAHISGIDAIYAKGHDMIDSVSGVLGYTTAVSSIRTGMTDIVSDNKVSSDLTAKSDGYDTVQLSGKGKLLANATLLLPTLANVRKLREDISGRLGDFFRKSGISGQPPVSFGIDSATGALTITGDRSDIDTISALVKEDTELSDDIRTLAALSSHASGMQESLNFQKEYLASSDPEKVVAKYYGLFGSRLPDTTALRFDGTDLSILVNGKEWTAAGTTVADVLK